MDARFEHFIDMVRDISAESLPDDHMARAVAEEARALLAEGCELPPELRATDGDRPGRHLLYEDPTTGFVISAVAWPAGWAGAPHDHGTWAVLAMLEGALEVTTYAPPASGPLVETGRSDAVAGTVVTVVPPETGAHRVGNGSAVTALAIQVTGGPAASAREFDLATGASRVAATGWTSEAVVFAS